MKFKINEVYRGLKYHDEDYSDRLEVSNIGNIRNAITHKVYKLQLNRSTGYLGSYVSLGSRSKGKMFKSHIAVASTFLPNPYGFPIVNHKDGVKTNCFAYNLEWCTYKHNTQHAFRNGLIVPCKGESHPKSKLSLSDIEYVKDIYIPRDPYYGLRALSRLFGVNHSSLRRHLL